MEMEPSTDGTAADERIYETVRRRIDGCSYKFIFGNVTWHSNDGYLTLRGCVPSFYLKQVLQELLHGIERVKLIINSVDVVSSTGMSSERSDNRGLCPNHFHKRDLSMIQLKRAYDKPDSQDGFRVLVEPYWPRDLGEKDAEFDQWLKEVAPSAELHQRFGQHPNVAKWAEFEQCYRAELQEKHKSIKFLHAKSLEGVLTLIHAAHDEDHSSAAVLKRFLEETATNSASN